MPRYQFTSRDLAPLRPLLRLPFAERALAAATPIKHVEPSTREVEETAALPVPVQSREHPDGVPLHEVLAELKRRSPGVRGLAVRGDAVVITHARAPKRAERAALQEVLGDRQRLLALRDRAPRRPPRDDDLGVLLDDDADDATWLAAFRRRTVARLREEDDG